MQPNAAPSDSRPPSRRAAKRVGIAIEMHYTFPWHLEAYRGIVEYGEEHGWTCVLDPYLSGLSGDGTQPYDGVVGRVNSTLYEPIKGLDVPVVTLVGVPGEVPIPSVIADVKRGAQKAGEHLIGCGYRHYGFVGLDGSPAKGMILEELTKTLAEQEFDPPVAIGLPMNFELQPDTMRDTRRRLLDWLSQVEKPIGILVETVEIPTLLIHLCGELGLSVPEDVGVVAIWADQATANATKPSLSVIEFDWLEIGYQAASLLDKLMDGRPADPLHRLVPPTRIAVRESTDVFVCSDPMISEAMHYIADNVRKNLRIEDVAEHLTTSRRTLERRFEEAMGKTVYSEIRRLRVEYLKRMLTDTDQSIGMIADSCGFTATTNFARFFKQETGESPSVFRKRHRAKG